MRQGCLFQLVASSSRLPCRVGTHEVRPFHVPRGRNAHQRAARVGEHLIPSVGGDSRRGVGWELPAAQQEPALDVQRKRPGSCEWWAGGWQAVGRQLAGGWQVVALERYQGASKP